MLRELSSWITLGVCTLFVELASNIFYIEFFPPLASSCTSGRRREREGERKRQKKTKKRRRGGPDELRMKTAGKE